MNILSLCELKTTYPFCSSSIETPLELTLRKDSCTGGFARFWWISRNFFKCALGFYLLFNIGIPENTYFQVHAYINIIYLELVVTCHSFIKMLKHSLFKLKLCSITIIELIPVKFAEKIVIIYHYMFGDQVMGYGEVR